MGPHGGRKLSKKRVKKFSKGGGAVDFIMGREVEKLKLARRRKPCRGRKEGKLKNKVFWEGGYGTFCKEEKG